MASSARVQVHRIADGTKPVWEKAAWTIDGHGEPDMSWDSRRTPLTALA